MGKFKESFAFHSRLYSSQIVLGLISIVSHNFNVVGSITAKDTLEVEIPYPSPAQEPCLLSWAGLTLK